MACILSSQQIYESPNYRWRIESNQSFCMEKITDGVPQGSVLGPLLFLIYVNDLPKTINYNTVPILFADNTSIVIKSSNVKDFQTNMVTAFDSVNKWFKVNSLSINVEKAHYIKFKTKNKPTFAINIVCDNNLITPVPNIEFFGIYLQAGFIILNILSKN
jgi:hypothetical protein